MSTFSELIDATSLYLYGYTTLQDQATSTAGSVSATDLTIPVADTTAISRGIIEIDTELMWVDSVNPTNNTVTIAPYGRGYRGSTATTHSAGSRIASSPLFPRMLVGRAINEAIHAVYPDLFAIGETNLTYSPAVNTYALPAGALQVMQVMWQTVGPSKEWMPVRRWRIDKHAATSVFTSGASLSIYDSITPGRTIKVVYTKAPSLLVNPSDDFATVTGLQSSAEDVIRLGASYRLVPFFDSPHLSGMSAEADFAANLRPVGGASTLSKYMLQMYQVRLAEEARRLQDIFPVRSHYTR